MLKTTSLAALGSVSCAIIIGWCYDFHAPHNSDGPVSLISLRGQDFDSKSPRNIPHEEGDLLELDKPRPSARSRAIYDQACQLAGTPEWPSARHALYISWGEADPSAALRHASENNPGASTACISSVLKGWLRRNPQSALKWVTDQPANAESSLWLTQLAEEWPADKLSDFAFAAVAAAPLPGGVNPVMAYSRRLFSVSPLKAFEWLAGEVAGSKIQDAVVADLMTEWALAESEAASLWLAKAPEEAAWRDSAVAGLARSISRQDIASARVWANTIVNDKVRLAAVQCVEAQFQASTNSIQSVQSVSETE